MSTQKTKLLYLFTALAFVMACGPAIATTPFPTADPNEINTIIAQTANAASTQTAAARPTFTFTPTFTPTRPSPTISPTATSTVIFVLFTPTMQVVPTFTPISSSGSGSGSGSGGGSTTSSANYACQILSVSPANGTSMDENTDFDTNWNIKNIGQKNWDRNSVDFIYFSGTKMHKVAGYDLRENVNKGASTTLGVDMVAPKDSGTYTTTWTLRVGDDDFCKMSITINVK